MTRRPPYEPGPGGTFCCRTGLEQSEAYAWTIKIRRQSTQQRPLAYEVAMLGRLSTDAYGPDETMHENDELADTLFGIVLRGCPLDACEPDETTHYRALGYVQAGT